MLRIPCLAALGLCATLAAADKPKILHVDSCHEGYSWSDGIIAGAVRVLGDKATLRVVRMDTKRNSDEAFKVGQYQPVAGGHGTGSQRRGDRFLADPRGRAGRH